MSETSSTASTPSVNENYLDLLDFHERITEPTWDDVQGLGSAYQQARLSSHTTQVGASLAGMGAFNRPEIGGHAESWVIASCARLGIRTEGQTLYAPWASCHGCALDIVASGISRVVTHFPVMGLTPHRWQHSIQQGLSLLYDHGVQVDMVIPPLGGLKIQFDGKEVEV